jgi:hypothetical protein
MTMREKHVRCYIVRYTDCSRNVRAVPRPWRVFLIVYDHVTDSLQLDAYDLEVSVRRCQYIEYFTYLH